MAVGMAHRLEAVRARRLGGFYVSFPRHKKRVVGKETCGLEEERGQGKREKNKTGGQTEQ